MNSPRTTLYRDKHNAKLMGVCSGIADYTGVNVFWVRLGTLALSLGLGWPIFAYFIAGAKVRNPCAARALIEKLR